MRSGQRWTFAVCVIGIAAILASCATPFVVACRDIAQDKESGFKYNEQQAAVACDRAQFYAFPGLVRFDKDKKVWVAEPSGLKTADLQTVLENQAKDIDFFLSFENRKFADQIDWFRGLRAGLEKQEKVTSEILRRLLTASVLSAFAEKTGPLPADVQENEMYKYFFPKGTESYSLRLFHARPDRRIETVPFKAAYLEAAKKDGTLKLVGSIDLDSFDEFAKKIPNLYDSNAFSWEKRERGVAIRAYKIVPKDGNPEDNKIQYLEIFRKAKGVLESEPAVRGFLASGGAQVQVFLIDYDREGRVGYGSPNELWASVASVATAEDVLLSQPLREKLLGSIYDPPEGAINRDRPQRKPQPRPPVYTTIVKAGDSAIDLWEKGAWSVPFVYKTMFSVIELTFKPAHTEEEKRLEAQEKLKQLTGWKRSFRVDGTILVVEYWKPKKEYAERNIVDAVAPYGNDSLRIRRKGALVEETEPGFFGELHMVEYSFGGKWFRMTDGSGNGVFAKRKETAKPITVVAPLVDREGGGT